jgi:AAA15 family ATPase/GTPase
VTVEAFRLWNFMGFEGSDWVTLHPISLLFGRNATGKSAILRALLLLRQSLVSPTNEDALTLSCEDGIDFGSFDHLLHRKKNSIKERALATMAFGFRCRISPNLLESFQSRERRLLAQAEGVHPISEAESWATLRLDFGLGANTKHIILRSVEIRIPWRDPENPAGDETLVFFAKRSQHKWSFESNAITAKWFIENVKSLRYEAMHTNQAAFLPTLPEMAVVVDKEREQEPDCERTEAQVLGLKAAPPELRPETVSRLRQYGLEIPETAQKSITTTPEHNVHASSVAGELQYRENDYEIVGNLLDAFNSAISKWLKGLHYLGPVRSSPQRFYYVPRATQESSSGHSRNIVHNFLCHWGSRAWDEKLKQINTLLNTLDEGLRLLVYPLDKARKPYESLFEVILQKSDEPEVNVCDTGFGWSQITPIVLACVVAEEGSTILIEEPESHLHPAAQAKLGDLFILLSKQNKSFFIETHSENLLLRFRRRIAQTSGQVSEAANFPLTNNDFGSYFVDRQNGVSSIERLVFDEWGDYTYRPPRFGDFFGQDFDELIKMKKARLEQG